VPVASSANFVPAWQTTAAVLLCAGIETGFSNLRYKCGWITSFRNSDGIAILVVKQKMLARMFSANLMKVQQSVQAKRLNSNVQRCFQLPG
jgi:hypothetical protein